MAWSYRADRADEVYATTSGPAAATTEQLPRPPMDGEDTDNVLNPAEAPEGEKVKKVDPEAAPPPPPSTTGMSQEEIQKEKLGPAPPPSAEEQQKAIDEARGAGEKEEKKTEAKPQNASKK